MDTSDEPTRFFGVTNAGSTTITISDYWVAGHSNDFTVYVPSEISTESRENLKIIFKHQEMGGRTCTVHIVSDAVVSNYSFVVAGFGTNVVMPSMDILGSNLDPITNKSTVISIPLGTDFGTNVIGVNVSHTFYITNASPSSPLLLARPVSTNSSFEVTDWPERVEAGTTSNFTARYLGMASGRFRSKLIFTNNLADPLQNPYSFDVEGESYASPEANMLLLGTDGLPIGSDDAPSAIHGSDFGDRRMFSPLTRTFTVTNMGNGTLAITGVSTSGTDAASFALLNRPSSVAPGSTASFQVRFTPQSAGALSAQFELENTSVNESNYIFRVAGFGLRPQMLVLGQNGDAVTNGETNVFYNAGTHFGTNELTNSSTRTFTVTNAGDTVLSLVQPVSSSGQFSVTNWPATVAAHSSATFQVYFESTVLGTNRATLTFTNDTPDANPYRFDVEGVTVRKPVPWLVVFGTNQAELADNEAPSSAKGTDYGEVLTNHLVFTHILSVTNQGNVPLLITNIVKSGTGASYFELTNMPSSLAAGEGAQFVLRYYPSTTGTHDVSFRLDNTSSNMPVFRLNAQAVAIDPVIYVYGTNGDLIANGSTNLLIPNGTEYGQKYNGSPETHRFAVSNAGTYGNLRISYSGTSSEFVFVNPPAAIPPGALVNLDVQYRRSVDGTNRSTLMLDHNAWTNDPFTFDVGGSAKPVPKLYVLYTNGQVVTSGSAPGESRGTDFGDLWTNQPVQTRTFLVTNAGVDELYLTALNTNGPGASKFTLTGLPTNLAVGEVQSFDMTFDPAAPGAYSAFFSIVNNSSNATPEYIINVAGDAVWPGIGLAASNGTPIARNSTVISDGLGTWFGTNYEYATVTHTFSISNSGTAGDLTITQPSSTKSTFSVVSWPAKIARGGVGTLQVRYNSNVVGTNRATIMIPNNEYPPTNYNFDVLGVTKPLPTLYVLGTNGARVSSGEWPPTTAKGTDFGDVDISQPPVTHTFSVTNAGIDPLTIGAVQQYGPGQNYFSITNLPSALAAGQTGTFSITFDHQAAVGERIAEFVIANSSSNANPYRVNVRGSGTAPDMDVYATNGTLIANGSGVISVPLGTQFGTNYVGAPVSHTFEVRNTGAFGDLILGVPQSTSAHFSVTAWPYRVEAGATSNVVVRYNSTAVGSWRSTIVIANNTANGKDPYRFDVSGSSKPTPKLYFLGTNRANIADGEAATAAKGTDFGGVYTNEGPITHTFFVTNQGVDTITITPAVGTGDTNELTLAGLPVSLNAGQERSFTVTFDHDGVLGVYTAAYTIANSSSNAPDYVLNLSAQAVWPKMAMLGVNGDPLPNGSTVLNTNLGTDFGQTYRGAPVDHVFRITNSGFGDLVLSQPISTNAEFSISSWPQRVAHGTVSNITVRYEASVTGAYRSTISLANNAIGSTPYTFDVAGSAKLGPVLLVLGTNDVALGYNEAPNLAKGTDYGAQNRQRTFVSRTFTLRNSGSEAFTITGLTTNSTDPSAFSLGGVSLPLTMQVGDTNTFDIIFEVTATGVYTSQFVFANTSSNAPTYWVNVAGSSIDVDMQLLGTNGALVDNGSTNTSADLGTDFGETYVGTVIDQTFQVSNSGSFGLLRVDRPAITNAHFLIVDWPTNVLAGTVSNFTVRFGATQEGVFQSDIVITNNSWTNNPYSYRVKAEAKVGPALRIYGVNNALLIPGEAPNTAKGTDYGEWYTNQQTIVSTFRAQSWGTDPVTISGIVDSGDSAQFELEGLLSYLDVGQQSVFTIKYSPAARGLQTNLFTINNNSSNAPVFDINVRGVGLWPELTLRGLDGTPIPNGSTAIEIATGTDFGQDYVGAEVVHTFCITNSGYGTLVLNAPSINSDQFSIEAWPASVAQGTASNLTIRYAPDHSATHKAMVSIPNNAWLGSPFTFRVQGAALPSPILYVLGTNGAVVKSGSSASAPAGTDYGDFLPGASPVTRTFTLTNSGIGDITISGVVTNGDPSSRFVLNGLPTGIPYRGSALFTITYNPGVIGVHTAAFVMANSGSNAPAYVVNVRANDMDPHMYLLGANGDVITNNSTQISDALGTDYGNRYVGEIVDHSFWVTNYGSGTLALQTPQSSDNQFSIIRWPAQVAEGAVGELAVRYHAQGEGLYESDITISNNTTDASPYRFQVAATAELGRVVLVLGTNREVLFNGAAPARAEGTDFGEVRTILGAVTNGFSMTNAGIGSVTIQSVITNSSSDAFAMSPLPSTLAEGDAADFAITFDVSVPGVYTSQFTVVSTANNASSYVINVVGLSGSAEMLMLGIENSGPITNNSGTPSLLLGTDFGGRSLSEGFTHNFTVTNSGTATLSLQQPISTNEAFRITSWPKTVPAGGSGTFSVYYDAAVEGTNYSTVIITNNTDLDSPYLFCLAGSATRRNDPWIRVAGTNGAFITSGEAASVAKGADYGHVNTNQGVVTHRFSVTNEGNATLYITDVVTGAVGVSRFSLVGLTNELAPGAGDTFDIRCDMPAVGIYTARFELVNSSSNASPFILNVEAVSVDYGIRVFGLSNNELTNGQTAVSSTDGTEFGTNFVGYSTERTFQIENSGTFGTLSLPKPMLTNSAFSVVSWPGTVVPGMRQDVVVRYTRSVVGDAGDTVVISNSAWSGNPFTFAIRGSALPAPQFLVLGTNNQIIANHSIQPSPANGTDYGYLFDELAKTNIFTLKNELLDDVNISNIRLIGDGAAGFQILNIPAVVGAQSQEPLPIAFHPSSVSNTYNYVATVRIDNDSQAGTYTFVLRGRKTIFVITDIQRVAGGMEVEWIGAEGWLFQVQKSDDLTEGWEDIRLAFTETPKEVTEHYVLYSYTNRMDEVVRHPNRAYRIRRAFNDEYFDLMDMEYLGGDQAAIYWLGAEGSSYEVRATDDLMSGVWTPIATGLSTPYGYEQSVPVFRYEYNCADWPFIQVFEE
ncbi:MAG: choice-of-anchor D domain-containing protein [Kiritimatiellae bacterium]|nr:choice-of-anchor D domain-containing protein [Kiritimatiellia bacterium]